MPELSADQLRTWYAALDAGFLTAGTLRSWAERQRISAEPQPRWVVNLYDSKDDTQALRAIGLAINVTLERFSGDNLEALPSVTDFHLGFLYLRFEHGDLCLLDLLRAAGRLTDGSSEAQIVCETFYRLANEIDHGGPYTPSDTPIANRVQAVLNRFAQAARTHISFLPNG